MFSRHTFRRKHCEWNEPTGVFCFLCCRAREISVRYCITTYESSQSRVRRPTELKSNTRLVLNGPFQIGDRISRIIYTYMFRRVLLRRRTFMTKSLIYIIISTFGFRIARKKIVYVYGFGKSQRIESETRK